MTTISYKTPKRQYKQVTVDFKDNSLAEEKYINKMVARGNKIIGVF